MELTELLMSTYEETIKRLKRRNHILEEENKRLELANIRKYSELNHIKESLKKGESIKKKIIRLINENKTFYKYIIENINITQMELEGFINLLYPISYTRDCTMQLDEHKIYCTYNLRDLEEIAYRLTVDNIKLSNYIEIM